MVQQLERIYVDSEFKKLLKLGATMKGKTIAEFTRELRGIEGLNETLATMKERYKKPSMGKRLRYDFP